ncbi:FtsK/SpoIIIE domain-containing protein [bacterium RCC_150]
MTFHCTLVRGPQAVRQGPPIELSVTADSGCPGITIQSAVAREFATGELTVRGLPLASLRVGDFPLTSGAVLVDGCGMLGDKVTDTPRLSQLSLLVHSGPTAGLVIPLARGTYRIGRSGTEICLPDPDVSRVHAILTISETSITLTDHGSANGTFVDGRRVRSALLTTDSSVRCGSSVMSIASNSERGAAPWGSAGLDVSRPIQVRRQVDSHNRIQLLLGTGLPILLGAGMALATGMWMFLGFTAISAVAVLVPALSGRRQRCALATAIASAVEEDKVRRRRCSPSAADLAFRLNALVTAPVMAPSDATLKNAAHGRDGKSPTASGTDPIWLRIGTSEQRARIALDPIDPGFEAPTVGRAPVALNPDIQIVFLSGPWNTLAGVLRFLLMQLAVFPSARGVPILIHGPVSCLPFGARFLSRVTMTANVSDAMAALTASDLPSCGEQAGVLFLVGHGASADGDSLQQAALERGWRVFLHSERQNEDGCLIRFGSRHAVLRSHPTALSFDPDIVPEAVFDGFCRAVAAAPAGTSVELPGVPAMCRLPELLPVDAGSIAARWGDSSTAKTLSAVIGHGERGPRSLDLVSDGPHILVAGTTGSGKSELLRTIISSISLTHSPAKVNFLFIDFKGGSGLGPLVGLPHCVGMLTDLSKHEINRSLASLRAEVRRREEILANAGVADLPAYWARCGDAASASNSRRVNQGDGTRACSRMPVLPRLVLVVDEFRMLIEDAPSALAELMRIAAVGRSLGIHLIMATQRPQGALSADIRANVTTSIALRVQSELESRDIINSAAAASIPVSRPGQAYIVRGLEQVELFQSATISEGTKRSSPSRTLARTAAGALLAGASALRMEIDSGTPEETPADAAGPLIEATSRAWETCNTLHRRAPVHPPVALPLPESVMLDRSLAANPRSGKHAEPGQKSLEAFLGLVDLPEQQRIAELRWNPEAHGHLGLIGPPGSGVEDACLAVAAEFTGCVEETHLYILDGDGTFAEIPADGRIGAIASVGEARRGVRILERIAEEISARQSRGTGTTEPHLLLVISSWGSWVSRFRAGPLARAEDLAQSIVRDGQKSGLTLLVTGDRELVSSRLFATIPNRAYFPLGATEESRLAWPRFASIAFLRGRALASGNMLDADAAEAQLVAPPPGLVWPYCEPREPKNRPFRVQPLPRFIRASAIARASANARASAIVRCEGHVRASGPGILDAPGNGAGTTTTSGTKFLGGGGLPAVRDRKARDPSLLLGVGGDEHETIWTMLPHSAVLFALGTPGSGKSSFLKALPLLNPTRRWMSPAATDDPDAYWTGIHKDANGKCLAPGSILLVDDVDHLLSDTCSRLAELAGMGHGVVATAGTHAASLLRTPLASLARNLGRGIVLCPRSPSDGDFFGVRTEAEESPLPGRAVLIEDGRARSVQLAAPE